jgi:DNA-binding transcriptional ArsR family regulator
MRVSQMPSATADIEELQVSMLRTLASTHRLEILHLLGERSCEVNEVARELEMSQAAASQHLGAMRTAGLVEAIRDGRTVTYRLSDPQVLQACNLMRAVLVRHLSRLGELAAAAHRTAIAFPTLSQEGQP